MSQTRQPGRDAIVVTGASTGIGRACALRLTRLGYRVFAGVRRAEDGEALGKVAGPSLVPLLIDITEEDSILGAVQVVADAVGNAGLAGLVNNAGIAVAGPLEFLPVEALRTQLEVNVIGQMAVTRAFLPLIRQGKGRIVNVGSISGRLAFPLLGPYCASKFALEALTASLLMELAPWSIHVALIEPGGISTPIWDKALAAGDALQNSLPEEAEERYGRLIGEQRRRAMRSSQTGLAPQAVARSVAHALTAQKPRTRYIMGRSAHLGEVLRLVPEGLRERLILSRLNKGGRRN